MAERMCVGDAESNEMDLLQETLTIHLRTFKARRTFNESQISAFIIPY
jgi:hypothetical protein